MLTSILHQLNCVFGGSEKIITKPFENLYLTTFQINKSIKSIIKNGKIDLLKYPRKFDFQGLLWVLLQMPAKHWCIPSEADFQVDFKNAIKKQAKIPVPML